MFTPSVRATTANSISTRNPRRRQRAPSDENGASLPRAKRQRSALSKETFVRPPDPPEPLVDVTATMNGSASRGSKVANTDATTMPVRGSKKGAERGGKGDGSVFLTRNSQYAVSKLPGLPDRFRNNPQERAHGSVFPDIAYALALTATHALVWPYTTTVSSPETFTFTLPHPAKNATDPLPLGSLVAASASASEPGLVVVMPTTGKITYWESITNAATLNLMRQQRLGAEGSVGSLMSGETVVHVENAEPAGMILSLSSGRVAFLSIRDGQGRPALSTQFMKSSFINTGTGLFGSIRHAFGGGWRRDVASVRAGPSKRGERIVAVATTRGVVQLWEVHRGGHHALQNEVNSKAEVMLAITGKRPEHPDRVEDSFEVLDVAFVPEVSQSQEVAVVGARRETKLLVLVAQKDAKPASYSLVELSLSGNTVGARLVRPIRSYNKAISEDAIDRPRLYFPQPYHTAFVAFDRALVIANILEDLDTPESQLLMDSHQRSEPFEDVVDFRQGLDLLIVGGGAEDGRDNDHISGDDGAVHRRRSKDPSCVLLVQNAGVLRVTALKPPKDLRKIEASSVQSKIEQAIHYGAESQNPLNFVVPAEAQFSQEEIEAAALRISKDILRSDSKAVTLVTPSMDHSLKQRSAAMRHLVNYLRQTFPPLSREVRWKLLWDAEKLAAARSVWKLYDARLRQPDYDDKEMDLLGQIVVLMHESLNEQADEKAGEVDRVRHWFTRNIDNMWLLVVWSWNGIQEIQSWEQQDRNTTARLIADANEVQNAALQTAFHFREENLHVYGLGDEYMEGGILKQGYEGLPEFWTSGHYLAEGVKKLTEFSRSFAVFHRSQPITEDSPDSKVIDKIRHYNAESVDLFGKVWEERFRWTHAQDGDYSLAQDAGKVPRDHKAMRQTFLNARREQVLGLGKLELDDEAIKLAEKYRDMQALVVLISEDFTKLTLLAGQLGVGDENGAAADAAEERLEALQARVDEYFATFGQTFADAYFTEHVRGGMVMEMLEVGKEYPLLLTKFLKSNPAYAKLGWICDISLMDDYAGAGQSLLQYGHVQENDQWSKKVELSMAKLARIAGQPDEAEARSEAKRLDWVDDELRLIQIQDQLYDHIAPVTANRIDAEAGVSIAMKEFGRGLKDKPALRSILEQSMGELLGRNSLGVRRLVDVLSLIDHHFDAENADDLGGREFLLALQANRYGTNDSKADVEMREKIIWRRCMLRDDWTAINDTSLKDDQALERAVSKTALFTTLRAGFASDVSNPTSTFRPLRPSDLLGAGTSADDLGLHIPSDLRSVVASDMAKEDAKLKSHIERGRLEAWFGGIVDATKKSLVDEQAAREAHKKALAEMEASMDTSLHLTNGHSHDQAVDGDMDGDGDGDVDMA